MWFLVRCEFRYKASSIISVELLRITAGQMQSMGICGPSCAARPFEYTKTLSMVIPNLRFLLRRNTCTNKREEIYVAQTLQCAL